MALSFGVTVLPDPPYQRLIELIQLADTSAAAGLSNIRIDQAGEFRACGGVV